MNFSASSAEQMLQFAVTNKNAIIAVVVLFCALLIYKMITSSDWVKVIIAVAIMILVVHSLTACSVTTGNDPLGYTSRAQLRADAQSTQVAERALADVQVAQANRDAQVGTAKETAKGVIESARSAADAKIAVNQAWTATLPILLVVLGAGGLFLMVAYWRGRVTVVHAETDQTLRISAQKHQHKLEQRQAKLAIDVQRQRLLGATPTLLSEAELEMLYNYAQLKGMEVKFIGAQPYLLQGETLVKVTPKALLGKPQD